MAAQEQALANSEEQNPSVTSVPFMSPVLFM